MKLPLPHRLGLLFFCGMLGALANSLAVWLAGWTHLTALLGVSIAPSLTWTWLQPRLFWGGLWALLLAPVSSGWIRHPIRTGLWLSLAPSLNQLLVVFPLLRGKGLLGWELGVLTPLVVLVANGIWGMVTTTLAARWWRMRG